MATKIARETWESIGRAIIRNAGSEEMLVEDILAGYGHGNSWTDMVYQAAYEAEVTGDVYNVDKRKFLDRYGITYRKDEYGTYMVKKYATVVSTALSYIMMNYAKKHKLTYEVKNRQWTLVKKERR